MSNSKPLLCPLTTLLLTGKKKLTQLTRLLSVLWTNRLHLKENNYTKLICRRQQNSLKLPVLSSEGSMRNMIIRLSQSQVGRVLLSGAWIQKRSTSWYKINWIFCITSILRGSTGSRELLFPLILPPSVMMAAQWEKNDFIVQLFYLTEWIKFWCRDSHFVGLLKKCIHCSFHSVTRTRWIS